jgi:hypothetical protein
VSTVIRHSASNPRASRQSVGEEGKNVGGLFRRRSFSLGRRNNRATIVRRPSLADFRPIPLPFRRARAPAQPQPRAALLLRPASGGLRVLGRVLRGMWMTGAEADDRQRGVETRGRPMRASWARAGESDQAPGLTKGRACSGSASRRRGVSEGAAERLSPISSPRRGRRAYRRCPNSRHVSRASPCPPTLPLPQIGECAEPRPVGVA